MMKDLLKKIFTNTKPMMLFWFLLYPIIFTVSIFVKDIFITEWFLYGAGAVCIAYMGGELTADFFMSRKLPEGFGGISKIGLHKALVVAWIFYAAFCFGIMFATKDYSLSDIANKTAMFAMFLSTEYISGTKANKIATKTTIVEDDVPPII